MSVTPLQVLLAEVEVAAVVPFDLARAARVDLSADNLAVQGLSGDHVALQKVISAQLEVAGAEVGMGGYLERRDLYGASAAFDDGVHEPRTVHLGVDIWAPAGAVVSAPLSGEVHSYCDNDGLLDYGGTIIVEHRVGGVPFFTLYGHLSRASLEGLAPGQPVVGGAGIAALGVPSENGGWPSHLHFQIIADMGTHRGDFPGACRASEAEQWRGLCPDPELLLRG